MVFLHVNTRVQKSDSYYDNVFITNNSNKNTYKFLKHQDDMTVQEVDGINYLRKPGNSFDPFARLKSHFSSYDLMRQMDREFFSFGIIIPALVF